MSKHVPGPWGLMPDNPLQITHMVDHSDPLFLAEVNWSNLAVAKANARLIAAAPELLEALRGYVERQEEHNATLTRTARNASDKWLEDARAAIAKATGEE